MALEQITPERVVRRAPTLTINAKFKAFLNSTVREEMLPADIEAVAVYYNPDVGELIIEPANLQADTWPLRQLGKGFTLPFAVVARKYRLEIANQRFTVTRQPNGDLSVDLTAGTPYTPQKRGGKG